MKKIFLFVFVSISSVNVMAQDKPGESGFKKENLFTGGDITLSFSNVSTVMGASPHFGYSINKWLDAAVGLNFNYTSERDYPVVLDKIRQTIIGPVTFVRVFPVNFLFAQAQFEHSFITQRYLPGRYSPYLKSNTSMDVNSLLVGAGYTSGRYAGNNTFYYLSIMFDVLGQVNSPYLDSYQRTLPIIKAGFNIGLFQGGGRRRR